MTLTVRSVMDSSAMLWNFATLLHAVFVHEGISSLSPSIGSLPFSLIVSCTLLHIFSVFSFLQCPHKERVMTIKIDMKALNSMDVQKHATWCELTFRKTQNYLSLTLGIHSLIFIKARIQFLVYGQLYLNVEPGKICDRKFLRLASHHCIIALSHYRIIAFSSKCVIAGFPDHVYRRSADCYIARSQDRRSQYRVIALSQIVIIR